MQDVSQAPDGAGPDGHTPAGAAAAPGVPTLPRPSAEHGSVPQPPVTGDAVVDAAAREAHAAAAAPLDEQLAAYERAHRALQDRLADVEG